MRNDTKILLQISTSEIKDTLKPDKMYFRFIQI